MTHHSSQKDTRAIHERILERKWMFIVAFFFAFSLSYAFLVVIDFLPEEPSSNDGEVSIAVSERSIQDGSAMEEARAANPARIIIDSLDLDFPVLNPQSSTIASLDAALLEGAVRHPDSADFRSEGTMVIFGHSSYLPTVFNRNYQAFNGIQKLKEGDIIRVQSADREYVYSVSRQYQVQASEASIMLSSVGSMLTLITCNSFGSKDDRFIVEATLIDSRSL